MLPPPIEILPQLNSVRWLIMRSATIAAHDNLHDNQDPPVVPGGNLKPAFEGDGGSGS